MMFRLTSRIAWSIGLVSIIAAGILSRMTHTGWLIFDKYLGDALYAAMVYVILRLIWRTSGIALVSMAVMTAIELFQLTLIPAHLLTSEHLAVRIGARLMGTQFSFLDLLAYAIGIGCIYLVDGSRTQSARFNPPSPAATDARPPSP